MREFSWSKTEKQVAKRAFDKAYQSECAELLTKLREMAEMAKEPSDLWRIEDFLYERRKEIGEKYDYRYSVLINVFFWVVREGRLTLDDLDGLGEDKLSAIRECLRLAREWAERDQRESGRDGGDAQSA